MKFGLNDDLLKELVEIISKYEEINKAVIFGSRSIGDYKYNSDIDIAIFTRSSESLRSSVLEDLDEINTLYKFDVVEFEKIDNEKLRQNIIEQGVEIFVR